VAWITLLAFAVTSCSTAINVRSEDYSRIEPDNTYRIILHDDREYTATNLVIKDGVASFTQKGEPVSIPVDEILVIQQINDNELMTNMVGIGIVLALVGGLVLLIAQD
jgi:hypothetical protein